MNKIFMVTMLQQWEQSVLAASEHIDKVSDAMMIPPEFWEPMFNLIEKYTKTIERMSSSSGEWLQWYYESILTCGTKIVDQNSSLRKVYLTGDNGDKHEYVITSIDDLADLML